MLAFYPGRSLQQGCLLFPYLFILCQQALSSLLTALTERNSCLLIKVCRDGPLLSHLMFTNNTMVFFKFTGEATERLKEKLDKYQKVSGQEINFTKSSLVVSSNTPTKLRMSISSLLNIQSIVGVGRYLGLNLDFSQNKS